MIADRVLFVDDDPNILASFMRQLRKHLQMSAALNGEQGLEVVENQGPFAVIVADMRMPGMSGTQFLAQVKEIAPNSVRMMLTGNADLQTAINAVNEGHIFRFLTKPCPRETLVCALNDGIRQYRLIMAEKELLEQTLSGSIKVLTEVLSLVNPLAFSRSSRIRRYAMHIATQLQLPNAWQYRLAAMLSQVGCVALPPDVLDKVYAGQPLADFEQEMFDSHPLVGRNLLGNIPRLEPIARMIEGQHQPFDGTLRDVDADDPVALGSELLKAALGFDQLITAGLTPADAILEMQRQPRVYDPRMVAVLRNLPRDETARTLRLARVTDLNTQMIVDEDVYAKNGLLLVPKGQEVTYPVLERLRNFSRGVGIVEPFRVLVRPTERA